MGYFIGLIIMESVSIFTRRVGFFRRMIALSFDAIVVVLLEIALAAICLGLVWIACQIQWIKPVGDLEVYLGGQGWYQGLIWILFFGYYLYGWSVHGQTIAMHLLRMRVQNIDHSNISFTQAVIRFSTAMFGLGNFIVLVDAAQRLALQDRWANCEVIDLNDAD
ncbi:MAG: hypothetical protein CENE_02097 [Candidatus Celerinatantimonas neptuna]|nr:MAG: hypothetical protein CENE_02097 [Candidatus Celerinatantimonas neptuna]